MEQITGPCNLVSASSYRWIVEGVISEDVKHVWERAWPCLERAVKRIPVSEPFTKDGIRKGLADGTAQLWISWDMERHDLAGALITEIVETDHGRALEIPLVGGVDFMEWGPTIWMLLKEWGRHNGCIYIVGYGRAGWKRLFGFVEYGRTDDGVSIMVRPLMEN